MNATPRPWAYDKDTGDIEGPKRLGKIAQVLDENGDTYLTGVTPGPHKVDIAIANAALIVRAVNSYDAMREALEAVIKHWHSKPSNFERQEPEYLKLARAALALAKGE